MIKVKRDLLSQALSLVQTCVETKGTIPVLAYALFDLSSDKLTITGTDLDVTAHTVIEAEGDAGQFSVSAQQLARLVALFEGDTVTLALDDKSRATIKCGKSKYVLPALARDTYPNIEEVKARHFIIKGDLFKALLDRTTFCTSTEASQYAKQGVLLKTHGGKLEAAATDNHRCAVIRCPIPFSEEVSGIIPGKAVNILRKILQDDEPLAVTVAEEAAKFEQGNATLRCRLLLGQFPNYELVFPKERAHSITVTSDIVKALRRTDITASRASDRGAVFVRLDVSKESSELKSDDRDKGEGSELVPITCETLNGEAVPLKFQSDFLSDVLALEPEVKLAFNDNNSQLLVTPTGLREYEYRYVMMPARL